MKTFSLSIRTPEKELFDGKDIESVSVFTEGGPIKVLADHADLTGNIQFSTLTAHSAKGEEKFMVRRGNIFVDNAKKHVTVLAIHGDALEHVSFEDVEDYLKHVDEKIKAGGAGLSDMQLKYLEEEKLAVSQQMAEMKK